LQEQCPEVDLERVKGFLFGEGMEKENKYPKNERKEKEKKHIEIIQKRKEKEIEQIRKEIDVKHKKALRIINNLRESFDREKEPIKHWKEYNNKLADDWLDWSIDFEKVSENIIKENIEKLDIGQSRKLLIRIKKLSVIFLELSDKADNLIEAKESLSIEERKRQRKECDKLVSEIGDLEYRLKLKPFDNTDPKNLEIYNKVIELLDKKYHGDCKKYKTDALREVIGKLKLPIDTSKTTRNSNTKEFHNLLKSLGAYLKNHYSAKYPDKKKKK